MKLVITGALGHIGSKLIRSLPPEKFEEVVLIDNFRTQRYSSLFDLPRAPRLTFLPSDVCKDVLDFEGASAVIHLAAITDAESSFSISDEVHAVNLEGTRRVADAAAAARARFIFVSTTSVYGTSDTLVDERCPDLKPQSPYAESKLAAEKMIAARTDLDHVILRFGTIFGPSVGMRFHTAVNRFVWQAALGLPVTIWRTALNQKRPYLDLEDAVEALLFFTEGTRENSLVNVVTVNATVRQIIDVIRKHAPGLETTFVDSPIMNQLSYEVDDALLKSIGFKCTGNLDRGIAATFELLRGIRR